jgi:hypothetical protein
MFNNMPICLLCAILFPYTRNDEVTEIRLALRKQKSPPPAVREFTGRGPAVLAPKAHRIT